MTLLLPILFLALGAAIGAAHFSAVALDARLLVSGGSALGAAAIRLGRIALTVGLLTAAAISGAPSLMTAAIGLLAARQWAIRRFGPDT